MQSIIVLPLPHRFFIIHRSSFIVCPNASRRRTLPLFSRHQAEGDQLPPRREAEPSQSDERMLRRRHPSAGRDADRSGVGMLRQDSPAGSASLFAKISLKSHHTPITNGTKNGTQDLKPQRITSRKRRRRRGRQSREKAEGKESSR